MKKLLAVLFKPTTDNNEIIYDHQNHSTFPQDAAIVALIFSFLPPHSLAQISITCKNLFSFSCNQDLWMTFCLQRWVSLDPSITTDWRKFFGDHYQTIPNHALPILVLYLTNEVLFQELAARHARWLKIISKWDSFASKNRKHVKDAIAKGIPLTQRGRFWILSLNSNKKRAIEYSYEDLIAIQPADTINTQVRMDARRNFFMASSAYETVCKAYSVYDREVGYCPALGVLSSIIMRYFDAKESFYVLVNLMHEEKYAFGKTMNFPEGLKKRIIVFEHLLELHLPKLAPIAKDSVTVYGFTWLSGTFHQFPWKVTDRLWDMIFLEGYDIIYFCLLAALQMKQEAILANPDFALLTLNQQIFSEREKELELGLEKFVITAFRLQEKTPASVLQKFKNIAAI